MLFLLLLLIAFKQIKNYNLTKKMEVSEMDVLFKFKKVDMTYENLLQIHSKYYNEIELYFLINSLLK